MATTEEFEKNAVMLFDVDGVIAETPHEEAWKNAALECKIVPPGFDFSEFYVKCVAGEPGERGAYAILNLIKGKDGKTHFERSNLATEQEKHNEARKFRDNIKVKYTENEIAKGEGIGFKAYDDILNVIFNAKEKGLVVGAVSSSEFAERVLKAIDAKKASERLGKNTAHKQGTKLYDIFDTHTLGTKTHWHNEKVEKLEHYCLARGTALQKWKDLQKKNGIVPEVIVFEDAPKGIAAISNKDFYCIGVSRVSKNGKRLATKEQLLDAGAILAYDENELSNLNYEELKQSIITSMNRRQEE
jgi:beta-phosphoglucomutase-like phosphatase (HAD superfamily)